MVPPRSDSSAREFPSARPSGSTMSSDASRSAHAQPAKGRAIASLHYARSGVRGSVRSPSPDNRRRIFARGIDDFIVEQKNPVFGPATRSAGSIPRRNSARPHRDIERARLRRATACAKSPRDPVSGLTKAAPPSRLEIGERIVALVTRGAMGAVPVAAGRNIRRRAWRRRRARESDLAKYLSDASVEAVALFCGYHEHRPAPK